jgi:hypothetical protein
VLGSRQWIWDLLFLEPTECEYVVCDREMVAHTLRTRAASATSIASGFLTFFEARVGVVVANVLDELATAGVWFYISIELPNSEHDSPLQLSSQH